MDNGNVAEKRTAIYLSDEELEVFKWFWKHYDIFKVASNIKPGRVILNLDIKSDIKPEFSFYKPKNTKSLTEILDKI